MRRFIAEHYSLDEVRTLCFDLGVSYDEMGGEGMRAKTRELLLYLGRRRRFDELLEVIEETRPEAFREAGFRIDPMVMERLYDGLPSFTPARRDSTPRPSGERALLKRVKLDWTDGVLAHSLHQASLIELRKKSAPAALDHPWEMVLKRGQRQPEPLSPEKKLVDVFDESGEALLILGAPGSGKTTMLLELCKTLVEQAAYDNSQPVPVIFLLSTWSGRGSLAEWLVEELAEKYFIPKRHGRPLVEEDRLVLLLDGLDEVEAGWRQACVEAINHFRRQQLVGLAVCSRAQQYGALETKLQLHTAVQLQPLSLEQIDAYLAAGGENLTALRTAMQRDEMLQAMARTPMMLNMMVMAFQGLSPDDLENALAHAANTEGFLTIGR